MRNQAKHHPHGTLSARTALSSKEFLSFLSPFPPFPLPLSAISGNRGDSILARTGPGFAFGAGERIERCVIIQHPVSDPKRIAMRITFWFFVFFLFLWQSVVCVAGWRVCEPRLLAIIICLSVPPPAHIGISDRVKDKADASRTSQCWCSRIHHKMRPLGTFQKRLLQGPGLAPNEGNGQTVLSASMRAPDVQGPQELKPEEF